MLNIVAFSAAKKSCIIFLNFFFFLPDNHLLFSSKLSSNMGRNSYFHQEQKKIMGTVKVPLLELVLRYLPHLQSTTQKKDDYWEVVAIKLNSHQYETEENQVYIHGRKNSHTDLDLKMPVSELPTFSGAFVKNMYEELMKKFKENVYYVNLKLSISGSELNGSDKASYRIPNMPVRGAYSSREDRLLCELFYLDGYDVALMAELSRERFEKQTRQEFEALREDTDATGAEWKGSHLVVDNAKLTLDREKIKQYEQELAKKMERIEFLDSQNKKLLELNHALVSGGRGEDEERGRYEHERISREKNYDS